MHCVGNKLGSEIKDWTTSIRLVSLNTHSICRYEVGKEIKGPHEFITKIRTLSLLGVGIMHIHIQIGLQDVGT